ITNGVPPGHYRNWIRKQIDVNGVSLFYQPGNCMQCDEPSCIAACPVPGATYKSKDGLVLIDPKICINCGNCVPACPYGARYRHPLRHVADKCDFCQARIQKGLEPSCVEVCPTRARLFGDLNDTGSEVSRLLRETGKRLVRLINPKVNTLPNVYYLEGTRPLNWPREPQLPGDVHMPLAFWREYIT
ncbi:MAG: 4Fe-4S dicluster domain-containing protein, partial [Deltaproteobacteria bacterium]|nr:4Fe-4S dicluster domain-containing protein [Deltaproteobacteria bacterium]